MFSRALMWDSSSCGAKSRAEQSMGWVGVPKPFPTPGRAPQHRHLILSGNRPPGIQPCPRPMPAHVQHGRVPPELHEVLTELALVFVQDV